MAKAKYEEIYRDLRQQIEQGGFAYGTLLPSEHTLVAQYSCSRNTVRRALSILTDGGYVQAIHGKGVRVLYRPAERATFVFGGIESFRETSLRNRLNSVTRVIHFSLVTADDGIAQETGFPPGTHLYHIERVRYLDGKPLILDINYFMEELVPGLTPQVAEQSIYTYIEDVLGMQIVTSKRKITVEHATRQDRAHLDLGQYDCLAVVTGQTYNDNGVMFEYTQSRHQPDYFCFMNTASRKKLQ